MASVIGDVWQTAAATPSAKETDHHNAYVTERSSHHHTFEKTAPPLVEEIHGLHVRAELLDLDGE
jgi:hypothetical protein